jgi:hypothetical protein
VAHYPKLPPTQRTLAPADADLRQLQTYLKDQEFFDEIVVLKDEDMNYQNLHYFLEVYFPERLQKSPNSRFLFAYSGHGITEGSDGYLLASGAVNMQDKEHSVDLKVVRTFVDSTVAAGHQLLVLINACYSGSFLRRPFGSTPYVPKARGAHAITAGGPKELTWADPKLGPGSIFFEKLFAGLGGQADTSPINPDGSHGDGVITVYELAAYLQQEISLSSDQHQNPMLGDISRDGSLGGFFFLSRQRQAAKGYVSDWSSNRLKPFAPGVEPQNEVPNRGSLQIPPVNIRTQNTTLCTPVYKRPVFNPYPVSWQSFAGSDCTDFPVLSGGITSQDRYAKDFPANLGDEVRIRIYVNNGAADNTGAVMHNVRVSTRIDDSGTITTALSASNARSLQDTIHIRLARGTRLEFVSGDPNPVIGDLEPRFDASRQFYFTVKVVSR